jgi:FKBP-type peptidyl-prolyl cis-trans isomerase FklB
MNHQAMHSKRIFIALLLGASLLSACNQEAAEVENEIKEKVEEKTPKALSDMDRFSYAFGMLVGANLKASGMNPEDINQEELLRGLKASLGTGKADMDMQAAQALINNTIQQKEKESKSKNMDAGQAFLAENKKRTGVKTTGTGLQYEVLKEGNGPKPTLQDKVKVHYHGTLIDGTIFDSSIDRDKPISFQLSGVIQGWQEGLQLMAVGSKYKFYIPSNLGYGTKAAGKIPANSTLIFEVELLGINE